MSRIRLARLNEQLRRELSELVRTEVRDPRVGVVTITGVDVAADIGSAKIYVRALGSEAEVESSIEGLQAAAPFLRGLLGKTMRIRRVPELRFRRDHSFEHAQLIEAILDDVVVPEEDPEEDTTDESEGGSESE